MDTSVDNLDSDVKQCCKMFVELDLDMLNLDLNTLNVHLSMKIVTLIHTKLITAGWFAV